MQRQAWFIMMELAVIKVLLDPLFMQGILGS